MGVTITGAKELQRLFRELPDRVATKVNRRAVNLGATPILNAVKDECPVDQGDLKKSQIKKVTNYGMVANAVIGADADYVGPNGERPAKVDHLVVYGHLKPDGSMTMPNPYIQRGWDQSIDAAQQKYQTELVAGIESVAVKLGGG